MFSSDSDFTRLASRIREEGVTVNGFGTHVSEPQLGFGGVNNSGSGRYHGIWGFREFSNPRSVVRHC